jgi:cysteinyl-tRNA synthetase
VPVRPGHASFYSCGPTVYGRAHIGNMRSYVFSDTVARVLQAGGYRVRRVINITDVGHLVGDGDEGADKVSEAAKKEALTPEAIADRYTQLFIDDIEKLGLDTDSILFPRATEYIKEQIAMIEVLMEKGLAYQIDDGVYFDTEKFPNYGVLGDVRHVELEEGARVARNLQKNNPSDFALWRKAGARDLQQWNSPWGYGNPGWSIECSAMAKALLGTELDLHSGGMDHIAVHHNNEIAQSEAVNARPFVRYWLHHAFITIQGEKISKSLGNTFTLEDLEERGFHPLSLRYFFLQAHYRSPLSFSWEALEASSEGLTRLWRLSQEVIDESNRESRDSEARHTLIRLLRDDLATPQALALLFASLKDEALSRKQQYGILEAAEQVLGLSLLYPPKLSRSLSEESLPDAVRTLLEEREEARRNRDFARSDELRIHIETRGYRVEDGPQGTVVTKYPG